VASQIFVIASMEAKAVEQNSKTTQITKIKAGISCGNGKLRGKVKKKTNIRDVSVISPKAVGMKTAHTAATRWPKPSIRRGGSGGDRTWSVGGGKKERDPKNKISRKIGARGTDPYYTNQP